MEGRKVKVGLLRSMIPVVSGNIDDPNLTASDEIYGTFYEPGSEPKTLEDASSMYGMYRIDKQYGDCEIHYTAIADSESTLDKYVHVVEIDDTHYSRRELEGYIVIDDFDLSSYEVLKYMENDD
jgi:hypothetical protein